MECGCTDYLSYFEKMENYIRYKGKEDLAEHFGKSMMRNIKNIIHLRDIQINMDSYFRNVEH